MASRAIGFMCCFCFAFSGQSSYLPVEKAFLTKFQGPHPIPSEVHHFSPKTPGNTLAVFYWPTLFIRFSAKSPASKINKVLYFLAQALWYFRQTSGSRKSTNPFQCVLLAFLSFDYKGSDSFWLQQASFRSLDDDNATETGESGHGCGFCKTDLKLNQTGEISSANFPEPYPADQNCLWLLQTRDPSHR